MVVAAQYAGGGRRAGNVWFPVRLSWGLAVAVLWGAGIARVGAQGPLPTPVHIGATKSIYDEFGQKLQGNAEEPGDLVQVLWASNDVVNAPNYDGSPDPENPPVEGGQTAIGK
ncbi:MAG TPA: hypothetical protein EYP62_05880, partial [Kiritimatiellae bacterium]|nr:hypothetical protein [Kiritimatiellia bacterium]